MKQIIYQALPRLWGKGHFSDWTGKAFSYLKTLGVDYLWLTGVPRHESGTPFTKGCPGSPYAIIDWYDVNPYLADNENKRMHEFELLIKRAHLAGIKIMIDYIPNHVGRSYAGDLPCFDHCDGDWTDTRKVNWNDPSTVDKMVDILCFWANKGIDGFRCDMAFIVPQDFWAETIPALRSEYDRPLYFLAEGEKPWLHEVGFDASYTWECHHLLNAIAQGKAGAAELKALMEKYAEEFPGEAFRLMFTSNHDENSWSGSEYERMGKAAQLMAVLTFTLPQSQPLIYTAQETGYDHRIQFFEKDPVPCWCECDASRFYRDLCALKHGHSALQSGEKGGRYECVEDSWVDEDIFAFTRSNEDETLMIIANFSNDYKKIGMEDASEWTDAMSPVGPCCMTLAPWGWKILVKN